MRACRREGGSGVAGQVGRLLEAARVRARLSQGQVAERAGTSQQWVTRAERGQVDLRLGLRLLEDDADVAELARRRAFRGGRGGGRIRA